MSPDPIPPTDRPVGVEPNYTPDQARLKLQEYLYPADTLTTYSAVQMLVTTSRSFARTVCQNEALLSLSYPSIASNVRTALQGSTTTHEAEQALTGRDDLIKQLVKPMPSAGEADIALRSRQIELLLHAAIADGDIVSTKFYLTAAKHLSLPAFGDAQISQKLEEVYLVAARQKLQQASLPDVVDQLRSANITAISTTQQNELIESIMKAVRVQDSSEEIKINWMPDFQEAIRLIRQSDELKKIHLALYSVSEPK